MPTRTTAARWPIRMMVLVVGVGALNVATTPARAVAPQPVTVTSYDIVDSPVSGFGQWAHSYSEPFQPTHVGDLFGVPVQLGDYSGGSGTLNDGVISSLITETHLFVAAPSPQITLRFAAPATIETITISGGNIGGNYAPGVLTAATVTIGSQSIALTTIPDGLSGDAGYQVDDKLVLTGTPLASLAAQSVVLSNFEVPSWAGQFSITEITVSGVPAATEPTQVAIDILPGERKNKITATGGGAIPVAILTTASFNPIKQVNRASLTFGRTGSEASLKSCQKRDVNRDRVLDLECSFNKKAAGFQLGDTTGQLRGMTVDGQPITGSDAVRIVK